MKRINPATGKPFAFGDQRADGFVFKTYRKTRINAQGFFYEQWHSPEGWAVEMSKTKKWRKAYRKRNQDWLTEEKLRRGCVDCGYKANAVALDFDHLPGCVKKFDLAQAQSRSLNLVMAEAKKCEVVCANCHRVRTAARLASA